MQSRKYKAIFFDLDGTLLPIDMDHFLNHYFSGLETFSAAKGYDPKRFVQALLAGTKSMMESRGGYNCDRYWDTFCALMQVSQREIEPIVNEYYETSFDEIGRMITPDPAAAEAVGILRDKGYTLYLTTMPLFPRVAVEKRLSWAGCSADAFEHITSYENSTSTKPHHLYYQENIYRTGLDPESILMVGNNTREDMVAMELGLDGYLVTDWLLDPIGFDIDSVKNGSLADFAAFAASLPECE